MSSGSGIDIKALNWVKAEIGEALDQIRQALETHVATLELAKLDFIAANLHQITGTLHIVELFGPALLAEEMEQLAQALKNDQIKQKQDAYEVLTRGILQLPAYLEHLSHGHQDQPVMLLSLLNDLRAARGLTLLSENALFAPDLGVYPPTKAVPAGTPDIRALAKKLRSVYQAALVGVIRGTDLPTQTKKLAFVLAQLSGACRGTSVRQLWWVAQGVIEALMERGLDTSVAVKMLLGQLDRQLKIMVDQGEEALQKAPAKELVKNLLFYVAQATSTGAYVTELKRAFKLDELLPNAGALSQAQDDLLGVNAGVMEHVAAALKEDLLSIKETVDVFVRTKDRPLSELEPVIAKLRTVADTLGMLGLGRLRQPITEQENALKNVLDGSQPLTDDVVMGVAGALLFVESSLGDLHSQPASGATETTGIAADTVLPEAEYRSLVNLTTQEARSVLARVKDAVLQFAAQPDAFELLQPTTEYINDIKGAMLILGYEQAADLLGHAGQFLATELLEKRADMSAQRLDTLADVITGFEYFLESVGDDPVGARNGLNMVRDGLTLLGYGGKPVPEPEITLVPPVEPVVAIAVEAHPEPSPAREPAAAPAASVDEQPPVDPEVLEIFLEEAGEECVNVATQLALWKKNAGDDNALRTLRRSFHTVKGSGRIVGAMEIGEFAWAVESMLNRVLDRSIEITPAVYAVVEQARDVMPLLVEELRAGRKGGVATQPLIDRAQRIAKGESLDDSAPLPVVEQVEAAEDIILGAESAPPLSRHIDPVLAEIFQNETRTHLGAVSAFVEQCSALDAQCTVNEDLIRALHTLHGSAHMANIEEIAEVADALEKWAKLLAENHSPVDVDVVLVLRAGCDFVNDVLRDLSDTHSNQASKVALLERIAALHQIAAEEQHQRLQNAAVVPVELAQQAELKSSADEVDTELVNVFLLEAADLVNRSITEANVWSEVPQRDEYIDEIRRRFSTLHGGARIANLMPIAASCGSAITLLNQLLEHPALRSAEAVQLILRVLEWIAEALVRTREQRLLVTPSELLDLLESYSTNKPHMTVPEPETALPSADPDAELRSVFLDEAVEILSSLDEVMQRWHSSLNDLPAITEVQRALHTIKGGANMARIAPVGDLCHQVETLLQRISEGMLPANSAAFDLVQSAHDWMSRSVESLRHGESVEHADQLAQQIDALMTAPARIALTEPEPEPAAEAVIDHAPVTRSETRPVVSFPRSVEPVPADAADSDSDLLDVFLEEANEIVATMDDLIARWAVDTTNSEIVGELQRALHTIKGGARMAKVAPIGDLSHSIENIFEGIAQGRVKTNAALVDLMHTAYDWLFSALERVRDKVALDSAAPLIEKIEVAVGLRKAAAVSEPIPETLVQSEASAGIAALMDVARMAPVHSTMDAEIPAQLQKAKVTEEQVRVALSLLDELVNNAGEVSIYRSRIELQLNSVNFNLLELAQTVNRLREQLRKFEIEAEAQMLFRYEKSGVSDTEEFDPLELDRFSNMQQLSRSLVESVGDLGSIQKLLDNLTRESEILLLQQSRVASALQDGLTRTRLVPFSSVVPRLRRIVRQTAKELGKQIELHVIGAEGEMDRSVLNRLTPALEHMLRNAVDHGIEAPQARSKAGKPDGGNITLKFWREGAEIVLSIADDGAGMDLAAIRKKALERGLMDQASDLTDNEVTQFVLEAGFSTAQKVTQISGRGVGMDVVNNEIKQLNGTLQIATVARQGTTFIVRLPLTVSVNQALMVHVGEQTYAIPLTVIDGVVRAGREEIEKLQRDEQVRYEYGGHSYKFFHLGTVLNISQPQLPDAGVKIPLILARAGDHRVALHVEAIVARQEVVIKSVGPQVATVIGISGATIMNDGGVALILDLASLIRAGIAHTKRDHGSVPVAARVSSIMVVDDSITVRKVTERLLTRNNFETVTAKDGVDALAKLQEYIPDVMLLDIEMPRMDGYELATAMRNDDRLKDIPIIMITSRTGDKHRERAMAIGVNMYMGKPYQDKELLENINTLLHDRG